MDVAKDLLDQDTIQRATSYLAVIVLPLVEKPRPYCLAMVAVGEGFGSSEIIKIQQTVGDIFFKEGLRSVNTGGDGDSSLRAVQWSTIYTNRLGCKIDEHNLLVPVDNWFGRISKQTVCSQYRTHSIVQRRYETRCF